MIFNPKYTNRNYVFQIPKKESSHQRQDKIKISYYLTMGKNKEIMDKKIQKK